MYVLLVTAKDHIFLRDDLQVNSRCSERRDYGHFEAELGL